MLSNLSNCLELTAAELDLVILANIQVFSRDEYIGGKRSRSSRCNYQYQSIMICKEMFLHLYGISDFRLRRLKEHYDKYGIFPQTHSNTKSLPSNTLPQLVTENLHNFLPNSVEENAIVLPGRIPGFKSDEVKVLPSSETKASVCRAYTSTCEASGVQVVSYSKFAELWQQFHPHVVVSKPMTDLCSTCQQNTQVTFPELEKSDCIKAQQDHLNCAKAERELYRNTCSDAAATFMHIEDDVDFNESREACSFDGSMHYSFEYAQQVHIPSNPLQPGPIYFKAPRKCGIFGTMCEGVPRQVNYLIDQASTVGKGVNATISYVHHFFARHGLGENDVHLHADNCAGQNKNNCIKYSFLIAGHTKFGPDRCFGMLKKSYKVNFISSLYELARMVDASNSTGVNKAQLVARHDGRIIVPIYDWSTFLVFCDVFSCLFKSAHSWVLASSCFFNWSVWSDWFATFFTTVQITSLGLVSLGIPAVWRTAGSSALLFFAARWLFHCSSRFCWSACNVAYGSSSNSSDCTELGAVDSL